MSFICNKLSQSSDFLCRVIYFTILKCIKHLTYQMHLELENAPII